MSDRRFAIAFPVVRMPEHLGGNRAIIFLASKPPGADDKLVLATCMDINGRMHPNVPFSEQAIRYAYQHNRVTFLEAPDAGVVAPGAGLVGLDGKSL